MKQESEEKNKKDSKSYKKLINFYKIIFNPSFVEKGKTLKEILRDSLNSIFQKIDAVTIRDITFEKIYLDQNCFFGSICRSSDLDILTEIKSSKNGSNISAADIILESYTYFYIDFKKEGLAVIKTQKIPNSCEYIKSLFSSTCVNIEILPLKKDADEIKALPIKKLTLSFYDNSSDFVELKDIDKSDCEIGEFVLTAKLKPKKANFVNELVNKFSNNEKVKRLCVSTDDEDIDLLESIFTKHVSIELTKDYKSDLPQIKDILKQELDKLMN